MSMPAKGVLAFDVAISAHRETISINGIKVVFLLFLPSSYLGRSIVVDG